MAKGTHNRFGKSYHQYNDGYSNDYPDMFAKGKGGYAYHKSEAGTPWADAYDDDDDDNGDDGKGRHTSWRDSRRGKGHNDDWLQPQTWKGNNDDWYYDSESSRQGWQANTWRDSRPGKGYEQQVDGYAKGSNDEFRKGSFPTSSKGKKSNEYDKFSKGDFSTSSKGKKGNEYDEFNNNGAFSTSSKGKKGNEYDEFSKGDFSTSSKGKTGNDSTMHGMGSHMNMSRDIPAGHRSEQRADDHRQDTRNMSGKGKNGEAFPRNPVDLVSWNGEEPGLGNRTNVGRGSPPGPAGKSYNPDGDSNQMSKGNHIMNMLNMPPSSAPSTSTPGSFTDWSLQGKGKSNEDYRTNLPSRFENANQNHAPVGKGTHNGDGSMLGKGREQTVPFTQITSTTPKPSPLPQGSMSRGMQQVPPRGNCQPSVPGSMDTRPPIPAPPPPPPANFSQNSSMLHPRSAGNAPEGRHLQGPGPGGWVAAGAPGNANAKRSQDPSLGASSGSPMWPGLFSTASPSGNAAAERLQNASLWAPGSASSNAPGGFTQISPTWAPSGSSNHVAQGQSQMAAGVWSSCGPSGGTAEPHPQNSYLWGPAGSSRDGAQGSFASQQEGMASYCPPGGNPAIAGKGFSGSSPPAEIVSLWGTGSPQLNFTLPSSPGPGSGIRTPSEDGFAFALDEIHHAAAGAFSAEASLMETSQMLRQSGSQADDIHRAQGEAASRRAADEIQRAQDEASSMWRWEYDAQPHHQASHLEAIDFMGAWVDSKGNSVSVCSEDAWQLKLLATLSRPPRPDVHLTIEQAADGGWFCGNSLLDHSESTSAKLHWVRSDGMLSVWMRGRQ